MKKSLTPVLLRNLALPEHLRSLVPSLFLAAVLPDGAKNMQIYLEPVVDMLVKGIQGYTTQDGVKLYPFLAWMVNDIPGLVGPVMAKQFPAYYGACVHCKVRGILLRALKTTIYPSFVQNSPPENGEPCSCRARFKKAFKGLPPYAALADKQKVSIPMYI